MWLHVLPIARTLAVSIALHLPMFNTFHSCIGSRSQSITNIGFDKLFQCSDHLFLLYSTHPLTIIYVYKGFLLLMAINTS